MVVVVIVVVAEEQTFWNFLGLVTNNFERRNGSCVHNVSLAAQHSYIGIGLGDKTK